MKTKILKFGMPLMAFLLAIVFAFATEKSVTVDEDVLIAGYIGTPLSCTPAPKNCATTGSNVCKYNGQSVHLNSDCGPVFLWERMQ